MAEYIWIDGHNGVRSKTKVRIFLTATRPYHSTHSLNAHTLCTILQPFALRPAPNPSLCHRSALIGRADNKISLGARAQHFIVPDVERYKRLLTSVLILAAV